MRSAWLASLSIFKVTGLPSMTIFLSWAWETASATPFSSSLPRCAMEPVSGPACAMMTVVPTGAGPAWPQSEWQPATPSWSGSSLASARASADLPVPCWPRIRTPPMVGTMAFRMSASFIDSWPTIAVKGKL